VEMSIFTEKLPERWALGSILAITIQASPSNSVLFSKF
jgi:hypothetical protein